MTPSKKELRVLVRYGFIDGLVKVKIAIASASFKIKERSLINLRTAFSPNTAKRCVNESRTILTDLVLVLPSSK